MENWKKIPGYEDYSVSNLGRVRRDTYSKASEPGRILKPAENHAGYLRHILSKSGKVKQMFLHRLVALAFLPNQGEKSQVNHIDGNKKNNNLENLEWVTFSENIKHSVSNDLIKKGEKHSQSKLTEIEVLEIRDLRSKGWKQIDLAKKFGVTQGIISGIEHKKTWTHV